MFPLDLLESNAKFYFNQSMVIRPTLVGLLQGVIPILILILMRVFVHSRFSMRIWKWLIGWFIGFAFLILFWIVGPYSNMNIISIVMGIVALVSAIGMILTVWRSNSSVKFKRNFIGIAISYFLHTNIPLIIFIVIAIGINILIKIFIEMIKTVYFTIFYVAITMPMKIIPEYRDEVTHYLLHKSSPNSVSKDQPAESSSNQLIPYIHQYKSQGYTDAQISSFLVKNGWPADVVKDALNKAK